MSMGTSTRCLPTLTTRRQKDSCDQANREMLLQDTDAAGLTPAVRGIYGTTRREMDVSIICQTTGADYLLRASADSGRATYSECP